MTKQKYYVLVSYGWIEPTEFTVVDAENDRVVEHHEAIQTPMNEWKELALKLNDKYLKPVFKCDRAEMDRNEILEDAGINVRPLDGSVIEKQRNVVNGVEKEMTKLGNVTFNEDGYVVKWTETLSPKRYIGVSGPGVMLELSPDTLKSIGKGSSGIFKNLARYR